jgi:hypothetical protein
MVIIDSLMLILRTHYESVRKYDNDTDFLKALDSLSTPQRDDSEEGQGAR